MSAVGRLRPPGLFLTARWSQLLMLNYAVDPALLGPYLPHGTELDFWRGTALISVVGFLFQETRVRRIAVPFHVNFEEINLRFYVRRKAPDGWRRGVVFIKEIVPRFAIAAVARLVYNENYSSARMTHRNLQMPGGEQTVEYRWFEASRWNSMRAIVSGEPASLPPDSEAEFIFEHYYGYTRQRDGGAIEYEVRRPPWRSWNALESRLDCDVLRIYGASFVNALGRPPASAFLAEGSEVGVYGGVRVV